MIFLRVILFLIGLYIIISVLMSAVRTFIIPRNVSDRITRIIFRICWSIFRILLRFRHDHLKRDALLIYLAPVALLLLLPVWYLLEIIGFALVYYSLGISPLQDALVLSGSSLFTLGSVFQTTFPVVGFIFLEAIIGLILVALLISYLPTMYSAFQKREAAVNLLEITAGSPPRVSEMLLRYHRIFGIEQISEIWDSWRVWFAELGESHASHPALIFFRSSPPTQSWLTSAGAVLDAAAITQTALDLPPDPKARLCIRAGYLALRRIAEHYDIPLPLEPTFPQDPISVNPDEFATLLDELKQAGLPVKAEREQAWRDYAGWRVNYDAPLVGLAALIVAPRTSWLSDRVTE